MAKLDLNTHGKEIDETARESSTAAGRREGNIEDQLRVANELLRGLEILNKPEASLLRSELESGLKNLLSNINQRTKYSQV